MRKIIGLCVMTSVLVSSVMWSAPVLSAPLTMGQIYAYARQGDISALRQIKTRIDTIGRGGNTALCQAVYNRDYTAYYNLKAVGASKTHPCVNKISKAQIDSFNRGYHNWALAVNSGNASAPAGMAVAGESSVGAESGLSTAAMVGIGVGAAVLVGGGIALAVGGGGGGGGKKGGSNSSSSSVKPSVSSSMFSSVSSSTTSSVKPSSSSSSSSTTSSQSSSSTTSSVSSSTTTSSTTSSTTTSSVSSSTTSSIPSSTTTSSVSSSTTSSIPSSTTTSSVSSLTTSSISSSTTTSSVSSSTTSSIPSSTTTSSVSSSTTSSISSSTTSSVSSSTTSSVSSSSISSAISSLSSSGTDFQNLDVHPANNSPDSYAVKPEFNRGNFLEQINAQYAYARGYNGYVVNKDLETGALISSVSTTEKVKVGIMDTGVDITHPDLVNNVVANKGTRYGYNFDYGPCQNGDKTHCYEISSSGGSYSLTYYNNNATDKQVYPLSYTEYWSLYYAFSYYDSTYDWDKVKNDPKPHNTYEDYYPDGIDNTNDADHGTHIAGIIAATQNDVGLSGVAPSAAIVAAVSPTAYWLTEPNNPYTLTYQAFADEGVRVVNKSWGVYSTEDPETWASYAIGKDASYVEDYMIDAYKITAQKNIVSVVAAGNDGNNREPSLDNGIPLTSTFGEGSSHDLTNLFITVVAADKNNKLASYSDVCGPTKEYCLTAPGGDLDRGVFIWDAIKNEESTSQYNPEDVAWTENLMASVLAGDKTQEEAMKELARRWGIYSTVQNDYNHSNITSGTGSKKGSYGLMQGTSMAAPVVTGSVALLMSAYPHLSSQQIVEILFRSANKDLPGWGEKNYLYNEEEGIVITDEITTWTDTFKNSYEVSSVYGHGMVDLKAATEPLGELKTPVSKSVGSKQTLANTKLALPRVVNTGAVGSAPQTVLGLDDYDRPFESSIKGRVKQAYHNPDSFKQSFRSFMYRNKIQRAGVQDKLSFAFSSTKTDKDLLGWGTLDINYQLNDIAALKFSYRSDILNENSVIDKALSNPFMNMTDSYSLAQQLKWKNLAFTFGATTGKNAFYETDDDRDDEFDRSVRVFNTEVAYHTNRYLTFKVLGGVMQEEEALLGINGTGIFATGDGKTYYTGAMAEYKPIPEFALSASYYYGLSSMPKTKGLISVDDVISDSFAFDARYQPDGKNTIGLQFSSPLRIREGSAVFNLPVARNLYTDEVYFDTQKVSLKPQSREYDLGLYYLKETDYYDWRSELMMRLHPDHMSGVKPDYRALFGLSYKY